MRDRLHGGRPSKLIPVGDESQWATPQFKIADNSEFVYHNPMCGWKRPFKAVSAPLDVALK
jgi:hypothetical protein